jgi:hypothetical protein
MTVVPTGYLKSHPATKQETQMRNNEQSVSIFIYMIRTYDTQSPEQSFQLFKKEMLKIIRQNEKHYKELYDLNNEIRHSLDLLSQLQQKIARNNFYDELDKGLENTDYDNLVSPIMRQKIAAYYEKYKNKTYSTKYKIDKKIHKMIMEMGKYLEKVESKIKAKNIKKSQIKKYYYSTILSVGNDFKDYLAFLSKLLRKIAIKLGVLGAGMFYSTTLMSTYTPEMMDWVKIIFLCNRINDLLIIISLTIDPNRKRKIEMIKYNIIDIFGIHKNRLYSIYIKFIYKLYDILNAIMSFITNLDSYLGASNNWRDFYDKLESHITTMSGISHKVLVDVVDFDIVAIDEFLRSLNEYEKSNMYTYSLRLSFAGLTKLKKYYGDKVSIENGWIRFTLRYSGGRYYVPGDPLDDRMILYISGFDGDIPEKADFITAAILVADEIILDSIGHKHLSNAIIRIDLQQLRWLAYKSRSWLARRLDAILLRESILLTPQTLGYRLIESFTKLNSLQKYHSGSTTG